MAVYVDNLVKHGAKWWCHMIADTVEELHALADKIKMRRQWFQASPPASFPHYDLQPSRRSDAIVMGAVEVCRHQMIDVIRRVRRQSPHKWICTCEKGDDT